MGWYRVVICDVGMVDVGERTAVSSNLQGIASVRVGISLLHSIFLFPEVDLHFW